MVHEIVKASVREIFDQALDKYDPNDLEPLDEERYALAEEFTRNLRTYFEQPSTTLGERALKRYSGSLSDYFTLSAAKADFEGNVNESDALLHIASELKKAEETRQYV